MMLDRLYGSIAAARNSLYDRQILQVRKLAWPVVSVGNISVGGSGKTPFVIMLGELLATRGIWVDVLSRGYRRSTRGVLAVRADGSSDQFGDEALLIAHKLRCSVVVGESRYEAGVHSERQYTGAANPIHLLDDGFQHRQLYRDFDIVLLSTDDLDDKLLPSGRLREPLTSLKRADTIVIEKDVPEEGIPKGDFQIWRIERGLKIPPVTGPAIAFCGIARPQRFFGELRKRGVDVREEIVFRDHHRYTAADTQRLAAARSRVPGAQLITTEKDAINLGLHLKALNPIVGSLTMTLDEPEKALKFMLGSVAERRGCR